LDNIFREQFDLHLKILILFHWSAKIEVFDANGHEFRIACRYYAVEQELDCEEISSWGATVSRVVDEVASHSDSGAILVFLSFSVDTNNSSISDVAFSVLWNVCFVDEKDCFRRCC
jgi:hypothetical protein